MMHLDRVFDIKIKSKNEFVKISVKYYIIMREIYEINLTLKSPLDSPLERSFIL